MTTAIEEREPTALERGDILPEENEQVETLEAPETPEVSEEDTAVELESKIEKERAEEAKKDARIPASRHKEILEREREKRAELERRLAELERSKQAQELSVDLAAAEEAIAKMDAEYDVMITDGELEKAAALKQKIRRAERDLNEARSDAKIQAAEARATERARYSAALDRAEAKYPEINPDHEDFNPRLMTAVARVKAACEAQGYTPAEALKEALEVIFRSNEPNEPEEPTEAKKNAALERKVAAVEKTAKTVAKTPPSLNRAGLDSDRLGGALDARAVIKMSQKEFAKLTEEQLSKIRGDIL